MVCITVKIQEIMDHNLYFLINSLAPALNIKRNDFSDSYINNNILQLMNKFRDWQIVDDELNRKLK